MKKTPSFTSITTTAVTGRENQLIRGVFPRWEFTLTYGGESWLRDQTQNIIPYEPLAGFTEFEQLSGLFVQCLGSYGEFYYSDPDDNSRALVPLNSVASPSQVNFPIIYTWGSGPFIPNFYAPVGGIASIDAVYNNSVLVSPSDYSMDSTNTVLVFTGPPNGIITVSFHFYFRCRFAEDMENYEQWARNLWENKQLVFKSVKP